MRTIQNKLRYSRAACIVRMRQIYYKQTKGVILLIDLLGLILVAGLFSLPIWLGMWLGII